MNENMQTFAGDPNPGLTMRAMAMWERECFGLANEVEDALRLTAEGAIPRDSMLAIHYDELSNLYPNSDDMSIAECVEYCRDYGYETPDDRDGEECPFKMTREAVIAELEDEYGVACYDEESTETLAETLAESRRGEDEYREAVRDNAEPAEVLQWFRVSGFLARQLERQGEVVGEFGNAWVWGRQCCGQSVMLDGIAQRIQQHIEKVTGLDKANA